MCDAWRAARQDETLSLCVEQFLTMMIRLAFEKLPPEVREILCLVDIMGLKYAEAAEVMSVPTGTVMSRISRARKTLLARVDGDDAGDARMTSERSAN